MRLREQLEIRTLARERYEGTPGEQYHVRRLVDAYGLDAVPEWLRFGRPMQQLDVAVLADLLAVGVTARRFRWFIGCSGACL